MKTLSMAVLVALASVYAVAEDAAPELPAVRILTTLRHDGWLQAEVACSHTLPFPLLLRPCAEELAPTRVEVWKCNITTEQCEPLKVVRSRRSPFVFFAKAGARGAYTAIAGIPGNYTAVAWIQRLVPQNEVR